MCCSCCCWCCLQGDAPGCKGSYVVLSGRLSDVRGFNDFLQDFLVQVTWQLGLRGSSLRFWLIADLHCSSDGYVTSGVCSHCTECKVQESSASCKYC
jgi:hypothetical protein